MKTMESVWETTDFQYVEYDGAKIYADRCKVINDCGVFLYLNNQCISFIEEKVLETRDTGEHHYLKTNMSGSPIYLVKEPKEKLLTEIGETVIPIDEDHAWGVFNFLMSIEEIEEHHLKDITNQVGWTVVESIDGRVVKIEKGESTRYVRANQVTPLKIIVAQATETSKYVHSLKNFTSED